MRKFILFTVIMTLITTAGFAQCTVGDTSGATTDTRIPFYQFYNNTESQYCIPDTDMATCYPAGATFTNIGWYVIAGTITSTYTDIEIYLKNLTPPCPDLCTTPDGANGTLVYTGPMDSSGTGCAFVTLDTPFTYTAGSCLLVTVCDYSVTGYGSAVTFATNVSAGNGIYVYKDGPTAYDCDTTTDTHTCLGEWPTTCFSTSIPPTATPLPACLSTVSSFPYAEGFEVDLGLWVQDTTDQMDWTRNSGGTGSSGTGPTGAYEGSWYLYLETSSGATGNEAILYGVCFDLTGQTNPALTFAYHMYGAAMGSLIVEATDDNGASWTPLFTQSGDQGTAWLPGFVDLSAYTGVVGIRFIAVRGTSYTSDVSIDDIQVVMNATPPTVTPTPTPDPDACVSVGSCSWAVSSIPYAWDGCYNVDLGAHVFYLGTTGTQQIWQVAADCTETLVLDFSAYAGAPASSERGCAYDPVDQTYWIGGWNSNAIVHVDPSTSTCTSFSTGLGYSGMAIDHNNRHLWCIVNANPDTLVEYDISTGTPVLLQGPYTVAWQTGTDGYDAAGLAYDDNTGCLIAINQYSQSLETFIDVTPSGTGGILPADFCLLQGLGLPWGISSSEAAGTTRVLDLDGAGIQVPPYDINEYVNPSCGVADTPTPDMRTPTPTPPPCPPAAAVLEYGQAVDCALYNAASQLDLGYPFEARAADDFVFLVDPSGPISYVEWWGSFWNGVSVIPDQFHIYLYLDNGGQPADPPIGGEFQEYVITTWEQETACTGDPDYRYCAELNPPFVPTVGQVYWMSIQAEFLYPPQWGWNCAVTANGANAKYVFPMLGTTVWTDTTGCVDLAFNLYSSDAATPVPPTNTPGGDTPTPTTIPTTGPAGLGILLLGLGALLGFGSLRRK
jgi:MAM domain-containing protein meprin/A5/mu